MADKEEEEHEDTWSHPATGDQELTFSVFSLLNQVLFFPLVVPNRERESGYDSQLPDFFAWLIFSEIVRLTNLYALPHPPRFLLLLLLQASGGRVADWLKPAMRDSVLVPSR